MAVEIYRTGLRQIVVLTNFKNKITKPFITPTLKDKKSNPFNRISYLSTVWNKTLELLFQHYLQPHQLGSYTSLNLNVH